MPPPRAVAPTTQFPDTVESRTSPASTTPPPPSARPAALSAEFPVIIDVSTVACSAHRPPPTATPVPDAWLLLMIERLRTVVFPDSAAHVAASVLVRVLSRAVES